MCFVVFRCFRIVLSFTRFFSALCDLNVIQIVLWWFSFVPGCCYSFLVVSVVQIYRGCFWFIGFFFENWF